MNPIITCHSALYYPTIYTKIWQVGFLSCWFYVHSDVFFILAVRAVYPSNFGTLQPYRYHFKLQWTSKQAQWEFYIALLRSQDRFEFTREEPDSAASSGPCEKKSLYSRTRKCLSLFKISVMVLLSECIIWAYWTELYLFPECQVGYRLLIGEQYVRFIFNSLKYVLVFLF